MYDILKNAVEEFSLGGYGICKYSDVSMNLIKCRAISRIPENAKSIICFIFPYYVEIGEHNVSRYAVVRDYHDVVMKVLTKISERLKDKYKNYKFEPFSDNSPIPEVRAAALSGLGVIGENHLLINEKYGSWVFIVEIVTDMEIDVEKREIEKCKSCGLCEKRCPGKALGSECFNKDVCLSHVTQKKKLLSLADEELIKRGDLVWGCDVCQEVCPMNINKESTKISEFRESVHENVSLGDYDLLPNRAYHWRPKGVIERNIKIKSESENL